MASPSRSGSVARMRLVGAFDRLGDFVHDASASFGSTSHDISKSLSGTNRAVLGGQIADVAVRGEDLVSAPRYLLMVLALAAHSTMTMFIQWRSNSLSGAGKAKGQLRKTIL